MVQKRAPNASGWRGQHIGDEQAAVRAAFGGDAARPGDTPAHEVAGDGGEVVVRHRLAFAAAGLVPARAEFAAATDVGDHGGAAAFQPELPRGYAVDRQAGDAEAAIAGEMNRAPRRFLPAARPGRRGCARHRRRQPRGASPRRRRGRRQGAIGEAARARTAPMSAAAARADRSASGSSPAARRSTRPHRRPATRGRRCRAAAARRRAR